MLAMADIPPFSIFSAISEVVVTIVVLYTIISNLKGKKLLWPALGLVLTFELCVNVMYMSMRAASADTDHTLTQGMKLLFMGHGMLSLVMFVGLVILFILAVIDVKSGRPSWFRRHPAGTWLFVAFWMVSVISGQAIFVWRYGDKLLA